MAPIHLAASADDVEGVAAFIFDGVSPSLPFLERGNTTPLHAAAQSGAAKVVAYLLDHCGVDINEMDSGNRTALYWSAISPDLGAVGCLLLRKGADPTLPDRRGYTPLMQASSYGRVQLVTALLQDPRVEVDVCPPSDEGGHVYYGFSAVLQAGR